MREQEENEGFSNWRANNAPVSRGARTLPEEWIMNAGVYDADAMVARTLKNAGLNIDLKRHVMGRPRSTDTVEIIGKDARSRNLFWIVAETPEITELATSPVRKRYRRSRQLEIVTGAVDKVLKRSA